MSRDRSSQLGRSTSPVPGTHHVQVLGNPPFAQLLHLLAHVGEVGIVVVCILLCQVIDVAQGAVLRVRRAGGRNRKGTVSPPRNAPRHAVSFSTGFSVIAVTY